MQCVQMKTHEKHASRLGDQIDFRNGCEMVLNNTLFSEASWKNEFQS